MADVTVTYARFQGKGGKHYVRATGTGEANTEASLLANPKGTVSRIVYATAVYSASPTEAGVTFTIDDGVDAGFDATLSTGSANTQTNLYSPDEEVVIFPGDVFDVSAPAGGAGITCSLKAVFEEI